MLNSKSLLLILAGILIFVGLTKPDFKWPVKPKPSVVDTIVVVTPPESKKLKEKCQLVIDVLQNGSGDRKQDGKRLSELYSDLAVLIKLDGENEVVKTTEEIRQANSLAGVMLQMNIKDKYKGLSDATQTVLLSELGDDIVPLDEELRGKAVKAFMALSWACLEGSK
jgi:hypothetical protein